MVCCVLRTGRQSEHNANHRNQQASHVHEYEVEAEAGVEDVRAKRTK
jgi:hypothetical protein